MQRSVTYPSLVLSDTDGILEVRMNHPPANAMSPDFLAQGIGIAGELAADPPRAVVLTGTDRFFSGGVDLKLAPTFTAEQQAEMVGGINALFTGWYSLSCPVVAAVNGHAVAGGMILALSADLRVGARGASYGLTEAKVGIPYPAAAMIAVKAELDPSAARRLVLEAELVDADAALELGLIDELHDPGDVLPRSHELAAQLASHPPAAYSTVKRQLRGKTIEAMKSDAAKDPLAKSWIG
jgi:enoyl-CoA hydratase